LLDSELPRDIDADFVTALADSGTNRSENVCRLRSVFASHTGESRSCDTSSRPSPPGMNCRDNSPFRIRQQNRKAIRCANGDGDAWLTRDNRVSLTIDHDADQVMEITGLSMAARAHAVTDRSEAERVLQMLPLKYPAQKSLPGPMPKPEDVRIFRLTPVAISVLDYSKGFGHTDLVTCS